MFFMSVVCFEIKISVNFPIFNAFSLSCFFFYLFNAACSQCFFFFCEFSSSFLDLTEEKKYNLRIYFSILLYFFFLLVFSFCSYVFLWFCCCLKLFYNHYNIILHYVLDIFLTICTKFNRIT